MSSKDIDSDQVKSDLQSYLSKFQQYSVQINGKVQGMTTLRVLRTDLQIMEPRITNHVLSILGNGSINIRGSIFHYNDLFHTSIMGGNNELPHNFNNFFSCAVSVLHKALGTIEAGLWPPKNPRPVLVIRDQELLRRCSDLLQAPRNFDIVVREATLILEVRLRSRISHERLTQLIPHSDKQTFANLVNQLLSPKNPILSLSTDEHERLGFHQIMLGVCFYFRNPYHHTIDESTEWSWSWAIVSLVDHLLNELANCQEVPTAET